MFAYPEAVQVLSAAEVTDRYRNVTRSWDSPTVRDEVCAVADGGSTEPVDDAREAVDSDFDLMFDHDPAISPHDRVLVRGLVCDVVGRPFSWRSPFTGWEPGTVVKVKVREG